MEVLPNAILDYWLVIRWLCSLSSNSATFKQGTTGNLRFGGTHAEVYDLLMPQNPHNSKKHGKSEGKPSKFKGGVRTVNATFDSDTYVSTKKWENAKIFFQLKKQRTIAIGGGWKHFFSPPAWGNDPILTFAYFSNGLVKNHQLQIMTPQRSHCNDSIPIPSHTKRHPCF